MINKIDKAEFLKYLEEHPEQRVGQALTNYLGCWKIWVENEEGDLIKDLFFM